MENLPTQNDHLGSHIILRATRSWVRALEPSASKQTRDCHVAIWNDSFVLIGKSDAKILWGNFMQHLAKTATSPFVLGCRGCGRVSQDEYYLLQSIAGHQYNNSKLVRRNLQRWFKGQALVKADVITEAFADQLSAKGFTLATSSEDHPMYDLVSVDIALNIKPN
jgi:hypothetical protein